MIETKFDNKMRKKFVKDEKLPIPIYHEDYFNYFLNLYEEMFSAKTKYEKYKKTIEKIGWENYYQKYNTFKDTVINHVKEKESYQNFLQMDMNQFAVKREVKSTNRQFYIPENLEKKWISIDLKKANFHSFKFVNPDIIDHAKTYEDWIKSFEGGELFSEIKSIRQIVFGNLNPKRQQTVQGYLLNNFIHKVNKEIKDIEYWIMGSDEFMVEYTKEISEMFDIIIPNYESETGVILKKEIFSMKKNGEISEFGYIKNFESGGDELISVNKHFFAQAYKHYKGLKIHPNDLLFYHENQIATFLKPLI